MECFTHRGRPERDESFADVQDRAQIVVIVSDVRGLDSPYGDETDSQDIVHDKFA